MIRPKLPPLEPKSVRGKRFCAEYLKDYKPIPAAIRAGFPKPTANKNAHMWVVQYREYISSLQAIKNDKVVSEVVFDQKAILQSMACAAFANPQDFVEVVKVRIGKVEREVERLKSITDLTAEQASIITNVREGSDGRIQYDLMDALTNRELLGKNQGLFHQKLIAEHRHAHLHATFDLSKVKNKDLADVEEKLIAMLGPQAAGILGHNQSTEEES